MGNKIFIPSLIFLASPSGITDNLTSSMKIQLDNPATTIPAFQKGNLL